MAMAGLWPVLPVRSRVETTQPDLVGQPEQVGQIRSPQAVAADLRSQIVNTIRGKSEAVDLALTTLLSGGHLLVEDLPGVGKTLLARSIAVSVGGALGRVQCTPDLLPSDITGTSVFQPVTGEWQFRHGPIFANVVLVDEINRASPRTQAALLEPMEEAQVTVDGTSWQLPEPFFCIATQNPFGQIGTFPLPESQLDRFSLVLSMGLPDRVAEREIITGTGGVDALSSLRAVTTPSELSAVIHSVRAIHCDDKIIEYVLDLVGATRTDPRLSQGASPRATTSLVGLSKAYATVAGRDYVTPDDVQAVFVGALAHRVLLAGRVDTRGASEVLIWLLSQVSVPRP